MMRRSSFEQMAKSMGLSSQQILQGQLPASIKPSQLR